MTEEIEFVPALPDDVKNLKELAEFMEEQITTLTATIKRVEQVLLFPPSTRRDSYEECDLCGSRFMHEGHTKTCLVAKVRAAVEGK